ncbi:MAG: hypothetical protein ACLPUO_04655 [Streptosporangiaceae bacterium]|jgi:hypothetical protein
MSNSTQKSSSGPQLRSGPMITGGALVAAGALIALAGVAVGGSHLLAATRRWIQEMEVPPSELAKIKWEQAKTAAAAGTQAWQNGVQARTGADA